jgi:hypothetical protein
MFHHLLLLKVKLIFDLLDNVKCEAQGFRGRAECSIAYRGITCSFAQAESTEPQYSFSSAAALGVEDRGKQHSQSIFALQVNHAFPWLELWIQVRMLG